MTIKKIGKRVFVYVRVSTQEQAKEGYSIDEQIERLKKYCDAHGWTIVKIYTDAGYSGGNMDRPALQDMIQDIQDGKGDSVLVYKLDRLSRSQKDTLELIEDHFLDNNVDFVSMNENFDTSTPFGRAMIGILAVFAQLEREQIKERMSMGREGRAKDGFFHGGGYIPVGYDYDKETGKLSINEYEAMQIREIHDLYQQGYNITQIDKLFAEKGYKQKHGGWHRKRVKETMLNNLYCGYIKFNGNTYKGNHPAIIDEETYNKTLTLYNSKDYSKCKNHGRTTYLGGLVFCKQCTARYVSTKFKDSAYNKEYRYYACHSRRKINRSMIKDPNCKNKTYRMETLDNMIFEEIKKLAIDPDYIVQIKRDNLSLDDAEKEKIINDEIKKIDAQKSRFMDLYGLGEFTIDEVTEKVAPLNDQKKKLEIQLQSITAGRSNMTEEDVREIVSTFSDVMDRNIYEEKRLIVETLIDRIEIDNEYVNILWKFA